MNESIAPPLSTAAAAGQGVSEAAALLGVA